MQSEIIIIYDLINSYLALFVNIKLNLYQLIFLCLERIYMKKGDIFSIKSCAFGL